MAGTQRFGPKDDIAQTSAHIFSVFTLSVIATTNRSCPEVTAQENKVGLTFQRSRRHLVLAIRDSLLSSRFQDFSVREAFTLL